MLNMELPHDPAIPLLNIYLKELLIGTHTSTCTPIAHSSTIHDSQKMEADCLLADEWIIKCGICI
jgi:hypothetical protein